MEPRTKKAESSKTDEPQSMDRTIWGGLMRQINSGLSLCIAYFFRSFMFTYCPATVRVHGTAIMTGDRVFGTSMSV